MSLQSLFQFRGRRFEGGPKRRIQTPGMQPPKGFNVSGFSEILVLYFLNKHIINVGAGAEGDIGPALSSIATGALTPVAPILPTTAAFEGRTVSLAVSQDITSDFVFEYVMHMSAWLYSGLLAAAISQDQVAATMTLQSVRARIQHVRNNVVVGADLFDSGTIAIAAAGDAQRGVGAKLSFIEYFAVGDSLRCTISIRSTTNGTGTGTHRVLNRAGNPDLISWPHIFLHAQPTQETGNQALFARRV